jgi:NADH:ubiquinone oxidoreductase subunit B-like Fe-S oxidoreductase
MKEPTWIIHKGFCLNRGFYPKSQIAGGSFKTIPKSLKQLPVKN